jgi:Mrp family chromosome partitioning ATPase
MSLGVLSGFSKEHLHLMVRGPDSLEGTGLESLGAVPLVRGRSLVPGKSRARPLYVGPHVEAVHRAKLAIDDAFGEKPCVIGIASACSGEGKTTIAYSLAALLAEQDATVLVDWNLRSPSLSHALAHRPDHQPASTALTAGAALEHEFGFAFMPLSKSEWVAA